MQVRIIHTTGFKYDGKALASYNQARMTPLTAPGQIVVHNRLVVSPTPWTATYRDYFGNEVTSFEVLDPHDSMTITATSTVHTERTPSPGSVLSWEQIADTEVTDRWTEYLELPTLVAPPEDVARTAREIAATSATPGEAARKVGDHVHQQGAYIRGTTDVATPAAEAWSQRSGVCQDMAHLVIGALRSIGIPTRYVSGYLHPRVDAEVGETVQGESHAWVEWWDDGWQGFDRPTTSSRATAGWWWPRVATTSTVARTASSTVPARRRSSSR